MTSDEKQPPLTSETKQQAPAAPQAPKEPQEQATNHSRSRVIWWVTIGILILALLWFCLWFFYLRYYESTDDAFANGSMINVNPAIPGSVIAFYADDTDLVKEGQLLVLLDRTAYQAAYDKEIATLASVVLQVRQLYDTVFVNRANVENKRVALSRAQYNFDNRQQLVHSNAISNEEFIHAQEDLEAAQHDLKQAEYQLQVSEAAAGNTPREKHPLIEQQRAAVRTADYNLHHCAIYASATGYIAQRTVDVGQWITPTTNLMAIIPIDYVWVDANYKETQLTYMRIGQPATVWFDMYGSSVKYEGKVLGIASGTGSVFSLIPPQNATGNWIKIVQRLPVRISLDEETLKKFPMRLGISAEVSVDITNQNLPMLGTVPSTQVVTKTQVFDLDEEKIQKLMDQIVEENLKKELR